MPYSVGEKGSYGCSGYPVLKDDDKTVMGCHSTAEEAQAQIYAINQSEEKAEVTNENVGIKNPEEWPEKSLTDENGMPSATGQPHPASDKEFVTPVPKTKTGDTSMSDEIKSDSIWETVGRSSEEPGLGKACWEGYVQRGMKEKDGRMVPNCVPANKADDLWEDGDDVVYESDILGKAEGYSPPAGARSAARRAIKFKEDGKAKGAGTAVGWTRARQLANGETLSLSTVKRMYSYFSRHEVDKKGKDWGNSANPSKGYVMWLAWGGDAGYSWSRKIVQRETDKALFGDFGKDHTKAKRITEIF
ncbi:MAG: hypothetical protein WAO41_08860 [Candidatus Nanopelagicales bacterium]